jgi:hypothetical protein
MELPSMSQTAIAAARGFDGWIRIPVSNRYNLLLTTALDIEHELWSALEYYSEVEEVGLNLFQTKGLQPLTNGRAAIALIGYPENISEIDIRIELDKLDNNYDLARSYMSQVVNAVDPSVNSWLTDAFHREETMVKADEVDEVSRSFIVVNKRKYTVWMGVDPIIVTALLIEPAE